MTLVASSPAVNAEDVLAAAQRLRGRVVRTPLLRSDELDALTGGRIHCKAENLQRTGSFKIRGAANRMLQLSVSSLRQGVVAFSAGNHAQAVARVGRELGVPVTMVMPSDAPASKLARTRALGATVVPYDRKVDDREAIAGAISAATGAVLLPPYDDPAVIAGGGTAMLEVIQALDAEWRDTAAVLVPCGGGGLIAGCATVGRALGPGVAFHAVEPVSNADMGASLAAGRALRLDTASTSICDALLTQAPGRLTFPICRGLVAGGLTVTDAVVRRAMAFAFQAFGVVLEPGGAAGLAAVLSGAIDCRGRTVCVILSGGNVDPSTFAESACRPPRLGLS